MSNDMNSLDLLEARQILKGETAMLPEKRHLVAVDSHYQSEIIKIVFEVDQLTHKVLSRN